MARTPPAWVILLALAALPAAAAQEPAPARAEPEPWVLVVEAGRHLNVSTLQGPGVVEVFGTLNLVGNASEPPGPVRSVAIRLHGEGPHRIAHVRVEGGEGIVVSHRAGTLLVESAAFVGGGIAVHANGSAALRVRDTVFENQTSLGIRVDDAASLDLARATFRGPADGARFVSAGSLLVEDGAFRNQGLQLALAPTVVGWEGRVADTVFSPAGAGASGSGVLLVAQEPATLSLEANRFRGLEAGVVARGAGALVEGANDTFSSNAVGASAEDGAIVRLRTPAFASNTEDVQGNVQLLPLATQADEEPAGPGPEALPGAEEGAPVAMPPWLVPAALATMLAVAAAPFVLRKPFARLRAKALAPGLREEARARIEGTLKGTSGLDAQDVARKAGLTPVLTEALLDELAHEGAVHVRRVGDDVPVYRLAPPAATPGAAQPKLDAPLRPQEAKILRDMLDHPGTPQSAVAQRLGLSRQALHYHVKKLEARGLITKVAKGRETHCYVRPEVEPLLANVEPDPAEPERQREPEPEPAALPEPARQPQPEPAKPRGVAPSGDANRP